MKTLKWNIGIMIIGFGYKVRLHQFKPNKFSIRWQIGRRILRFGYDLRGEIPQRTWKGNHV